MLMNKQIQRGGDYAAPAFRDLHIRCEAGFGPSGFTTDPIGETTGEWDD